MAKKPLLVVLAAVVLSACEQQITESVTNEKTAELIRPARIVSVTGSARHESRSFPGIIDSNRKSDLAFRVSGQLVELPLKAGDVVNKGDVLAKLDSTDFQNSLDERTAQLNLIKTQHNQIHALFKKNYASQAEVDSVNAQLKAAQVAERQARTNLGYTVLTAPFSGVVARVNVENHQAVQTQQPVLQLQNNEELDVQFDVPESLIKSLRRSDEYQSLCGEVSFMTRNGRSDVFEACYKEHDTVADSLTRSYRVLFSLKNPTDTNLLPGMSVDLDIDLTALEIDANAVGFLLPVESVFDEEGEQWVWKLDKDMKVLRQAVKVSEISGDMLRVYSGLTEGDQIVAAGVSYLREGQQVRPLTKERGL